ncbi:uncharacterized protein E5676_scaffold142G00300 [Cucumis melo var. makuwa]|uniref:Uncharacterized protein n=1 Tax=Cucumis melo var. makuwa TaxID=1194695 RepID=A0A5A7U1Q7_CUCMM|nr:uncharacterized protein E6C27_scaffold76G001700 [Cucumis melo var. makuwa]TYK23062.1 uncharacterized protein E5676_scaffold142G00300 [Cucumis melo var. makuwa]
MKKSNFFISLLIPSPRSPSRELDVYLQPLIEELKELWSLGVPTYDSLTVDDVEDQQLNVLKIVIGHRIVDHVEDDTLCRVDVDPIVVLCLNSPSVLMRSDDLFDFNVEEFNIVPSTSSVGYTSDPLNLLLSLLGDDNTLET